MSVKERRGRERERSSEMFGSPERGFQVPGGKKRRERFKSDHYVFT